MASKINRSVFPAVALGFVASLAQAADPLPLIDVTDHGTVNQIQPSSGQVKAAVSSEGGATGLVVTISAGTEGYPGVIVTPTDTVWNLSRYGHVEAKLTNVGEQTVGVNLRVDEDSDPRQEPWNTESVWMEPGESKSITVIFGHQYGMKPGYAVNPARIKQLLLFTTKVKEGTRAFRVEHIRAGGPAGEKPPVDPQSTRTRPTNGYVFGGSGVAFDVARQLHGQDGAEAELTDGGARLTFNGGKQEQVLFTPAIGRWDLTRACDVRVTLKNIGATPVTPAVFATSDGRDRTRIVSPGRSLNPGESAEVVVLFEAEKPIVVPPGANEANGRPERDTGTLFHSDKVDSIRIALEAATKATLLVESVMATATPIDTPDWLGKRPPVDGDWQMTFDDEFDGSAVNQDNWCIYGPNWWGAKSQTHWSKDQLIVRDGRLHIRFEKKTGWHNDTEDSGHQSPYAGGFLDSYGKWTQRYGYFECRMKLPTADGLWPAFWMMPDRGAAAGVDWKRQDTANGGMEFDIMEHLTRWGPYNYHVAIHWDGYGKEHKSTGGAVYIQPDKDGYFTSGCLWLPGRLVDYANGKEVCRWESERVCSVPMCMMFTMPVGGWDNNSLRDDQLPVDWQVDYVRAWQRTDLASDTDGYWAEPKPWPRDK